MRDLGSVVVLHIEERLEPFQSLWLVNYFLLKVLCRAQISLFAAPRCCYTLHLLVYTVLVTGKVHT